MKIIAFIVTSILISACSSFQTEQTNNQLTNIHKNPSVPLLDGSYFGGTIDVIPVAQVYSLNDQQKSHYLEYFNSEALEKVAAHKRIFNFLEQRLNDFNFYSNTSQASQSLALNRGNCLSLAILTKALAELSQVDIAYQLLESEPVYQKQDDLVISSQHIRTILYEPKSLDSSTFVLFPSRIIIDYFPSENTKVLRRVDENEFLSMFYSNRAIEVMLKDNNLAYWYLRRALALKPDDLNALNIMAIIHEKAGYSEDAENIYLYSLEGSKDKSERAQKQYLELLNNYHTLLIRQNRELDAEKISEQISERRVINPFKWISLGNAAFSEGDYNKAISYFRKARKLAPYLHESHAGIARSQFKLGYIKAAARTFKKALKSSQKIETRDMYQKKLDMLNQLLN